MLEVSQYQNRFCLEARGEEGRRGWGQGRREK
jgi:hypothetical protein